MANKQWHKEYYERNKETILERQRLYYRNNRDKVLARNNAWHHNNSDHVKAKKKERYQNDIENQRSRTKGYWKEKKLLVDQIALRYGCQNPQCCWEGSFTACQLDFHHLDPKSKLSNVSQLIKRKKAVIATEINKCVVLCRNCHQLFHESPFALDESMICSVSEELSALN